MKLKTQDKCDTEKYRHRTIVLLCFTAFLGLVIIGLCVFIYKRDKDYSKANRARQEAWTKEHSQLNNEFTAGCQSCKRAARKEVDDELMEIDRLKSVVFDLETKLEIEKRKP
jgi:hypothetical protein